MSPCPWVVELAVWAFPVSQQGHGEEDKGHVVDQVVQRDVAEVYEGACVHGVREDGLTGEEEAEGCCEVEEALAACSSVCSYGEVEGDGGHGWGE
jgi:hypothetical protein